MRGAPCGAEGRPRCPVCAGGWWDAEGRCPGGWSRGRLSWADPRLGICIADRRHRGVIVDFPPSSELSVRSVNKALEKLLTPFPLPRSVGYNYRNSCSRFFLKVRVDGQLCTGCWLSCDVSVSGMSVNHFAASFPWDWGGWELPVAPCLSSLSVHIHSGLCASPPPAPDCPIFQ